MEIGDLRAAKLPASLDSNIENVKQNLRYISTIQASSDNIFDLGVHIAKDKKLSQEVMPMFQLAVNERSQQINAMTNLLRTMYETSLAVIRNFRL